MKIFTSIFCFTYYIVIYLSSGLKAQSGIDLTSINVNPYLYQLCWQQINGISNKIESISLLKKNTKVTFPVFVYKDPEPGAKNKYCIKNQSHNDIFKITLSKKIGTTSLELKFKFSMPLATPLKIIKYVKLSGGVYFEMNTKFIGISSSLSPKCQLLVKYGVEIKLFVLNLIKNNKFIKMLPGDHFEFFYTCDTKYYSDISTEILSGNGIINFDERITDLNPLLLIPFRRFLMVTWLNKVRTHFYEISILHKNGQLVKKFRIFNKEKVLQNGKIDYFLIPKSNGSLVEDLGFYDNSERIIVILDMVEPLMVHGNYKLSIAWYDLSNSYINDNFIYFLPLGAESCGKIDEKFSNFTMYRYDVLRDTIFDLSQTITCSFNKSTIMSGKILSPNNYEKYISTTAYLKHELKGKKNTSPTLDLSNIEKSMDKLYKIHPYFYLWFMLGENTQEIKQIQFTMGNSHTIHPLEIFSHNSALKVNWKWNMIQKGLPAAIYVLKIIKDSGECVVVYVLKCKTCNKLYLKATETNFAKRINNFKKTCPIYKEYDDYFDALNETLYFTTGPLKPKEIYRAGLHVLQPHTDKYYIQSGAKFLDVSLWKMYKSTFVSLICILIILPIIVGIFFFCRFICRDASDVKVMETVKMETTDEIYDDDIA